MRVGPFGATELVIILVIVLVIFGAGRIPEVFGALGKGIREFRKSQSEEDLKSAEDTPTKEDIKA